MEESKERNSPIYIEDAINITSGTRKYQKISICILSLSPISLSLIILTTSYYFPLIPCRSNDCSNELGKDRTLELSRNFWLCYFLGGMIASFIISLVADRYGRVRIIKKCTLLAPVFYTIFVFLMNQTMILLSIFSIGLLGNAIHNLSFIYLSEIIDFRHRNLYLGLFYVSWNVSQLLFIFLFRFGIYWRQLFLISIGCTVLEALLIPYIVESPRFLVTNLVDIEAASKVLNKISEINGCQYFSHRIVSENIHLMPSVSIKDMWRRNVIRTKIIIASFAWFIIVLGYYYADINVPKFHLNNWKVSLVSLFADSISIFFVIWIIEIIGRKKTLVFSLWLNGMIHIIICLLFKLEQTQDDLTLQLAFSIGKCILSGQFYLLFVFTAEMFPTHMKATGFCFCNFIGRSGGPLISFLPEEYSFLIIGVLMLISGVLSCFLEEILGKELDETLENNQQPLLQTNY